MKKFLHLDHISGGAARSITRDLLLASCGFTAIYCVANQKLFIGLASAVVGVGVLHLLPRPELQLQDRTIGDVASRTLAAARDYTGSTVSYLKNLYTNSESV